MIWAFIFHLLIRWFQLNVNEVMKHLNKSVLKPNNTNTRNLVLQGLKGSGKSTICKYICNQLSLAPTHGFYYYINCQNFMSKKPNQYC